MARAGFRLILVLGVVGAMAIACFVIFGDLKPDEAAAGALVALAGVALALLALVPAKQMSALTDRMTSLSVGKFLDVQLNPAFADLAAKQRQDPSADDPDNPTTAINLVDLKISLEAKIAYLAKHVLATVPQEGQANVPTFLTIGSLLKDDYLTRSQAEMAYDVLGMRQAEFRALSSASQNDFLKGASAFVDTVRIAVFAHQVYNDLHQPQWSAQWSVEWEFPQGSTRRDITVRRRHADTPQTHHLIPVFTEGKASRLFVGPSRRLREQSKTTGDGRRFIVVPPLSKAKNDSELLQGGAEPEGQVWIVTLRGLKTWLSAQTD